MQRENKIVADFYKSNEWEATRMAYLKSKFGICERCNSAGIIVHHKEYVTIDNIHDPNITLNFNNLELLCRKCHNQEHMQTELGYAFDEKGHPLPPPSRETKK